MQALMQLWWHHLMTDGTTGRGCRQEGECGKPEVLQPPPSQALPLCSMSLASTTSQHCHPGAQFPTTLDNSNSIQPHWGPPMACWGNLFWEVVPQTSSALFLAAKYKETHSWFLLPGGWKVRRGWVNGGSTGVEAWELCPLLSSASVWL